MISQQSEQYLHCIYFINIMFSGQKYRVNLQIGRVCMEFAPNNDTPGAGINFGERADFSPFMN